MNEKYIGHENKERLDLNKMLGNLKIAPIDLQAAIFTRMIKKL
jgi:hypothetical protein